MPLDPTEFEALFASRGGFELCYKKLLLAAKFWLSLYGGNKAGRLAVRQLDPEELLNIGIERLFTEEFEPGTDVYLLLRRHMHNHVRSLAKSAGEAKLVRAESSPEAKARYLGQDDPTEPGPTDRILVTDDMEFCNQVLFQVCQEAEKDPQVRALATAIIEGFFDFEEQRIVTGMSQAEHDAAFKRLKRWFWNTLSTMKEDPK